MKKKLSAFRLVFLIYILILAGLVLAAVSYVSSLLREYEASQPEAYVQQAVEQLRTDAASGDFWSKYSGISEINPGEFEQNIDVKAQYLVQFTSENLEFTQNSAPSEDELCYDVKHNGVCIARVNLKAQGPAETKLAVFSIREWAVTDVAPVLQAQDYTLTVPASFKVTVNGIPLTEKHGSVQENRQVKYTVPSVYLTPEFSIVDATGEQGEYTLKNGRVRVEFFDYSLTLPTSLTVTVNGEKQEGKVAGTGSALYEIAGLSKPTVEISDHFGNTVHYEGGAELPLTCAVFTASERYHVQVQGKPVPEQAVIKKDNPEYATFAQFVENLPLLCEYNIAILENDAVITATDPAGAVIDLGGESVMADLTVLPGLDAVPDSVAAEVNVLTVAQNWSKFLTRDLAFSKITPYLIFSSYQYQVAQSYANGPDISYTSRHTLLDPPFRDNNVTNFVWITDDCFSVDISFVKQMRLYYGALVDDPMNDRFYFVKYDDTADGVDNPTWMLASMKEIVDNDSDE